MVWRGGRGWEGESGRMKSGRRLGKFGSKRPSKSTATFCLPQHVVLCMCVQALGNQWTWHAVADRHRVAATHQQHASPTLLYTVPCTGSLHDLRLL